MTLWFVFALMTAAAIFAVLWPLGQGANAQGGSELAVYRDQLDEIERDRAAGLIGATEADAARVEISRRLIAAADAAEFTYALPIGSPLWRRRALTVGAVVLLPIIAAAFYLALGSPQLPGQPLADRVDEARQGRSIASLVSQAEAHLERNPDDIRGYEVLAPVYLRMGRFADAVSAQRKLLTLGGETPDGSRILGRRSSRRRMASLLPRPNPRSSVLWHSIQKNSKPDSTSVSRQSRTAIGQKQPRYGAPWRRMRRPMHHGFRWCGKRWHA